MSSGKSFLDQEYPAPKGEPVDLIIAFAFGAFIATFLLVFEPFDLNVLYYSYKTLKIAFFGVITGATLLVFLYLIPKVFPKVFDDSHWQVMHQLLYFGLILFVIATANGLYINYLSDLSFDWSNYVWIIVRTYAIGSIPLTILILFVYNQRLKTHLLEASQLNQAQPHEELQKEDELLIILENGKDQLALKSSDLVYMKSEGNYLNAFQRENATLTKSLHRVALSSVVEQIDLPHIQRCHRSYLVNLSHVLEFSGNAQGLKLTLEGVEEAIPVSRKYLEGIRAYFGHKN